MKISPNTAKLFVEQVNNELAASYSYLGMAAYFDSQDLPGFASWFRMQSAEETAHAMKIYDFVIECGVEIELNALPAPRCKFQSPESVISAGLEQEQAVTRQIKAIYRSSLDEGDFTAQTLLHWFLDEQMEEESSFEQLLIEINAVTNKFELLQMDKAMAARKPEAA